MDEFGDNTGPGQLFKLQPGVIKIKLSGNKKIYTHIPYSNISDETIILKKGNTLGTLSLVDEVILAAGPSRQENNNNESPAADQGVKTSEFQATANTAEATEEKRKIGYTDEMQKDYSDPVTRHFIYISYYAFLLSNFRDSCCSLKFGGFYALVCCRALVVVAFFKNNCFIT